MDSRGKIARSTRPRSSFARISHASTRGLHNAVTTRVLEREKEREMGEQETSSMNHDRIERYENDLR